MPPVVFYYHLERGVYNFGGRLLLRPVALEDGALIAYWRNTPLARQAFFKKDVVTPDSHGQWLAQKDPYDLVWLIEVAKGLERENVIGMTALHIDPINCTAEYGRTFVDGRYQGQGYGTEIDYLTLATGFEVFQLQSLWLDIYTANERMIYIHEKTGWLADGTHDRADQSVMTMRYTRAAWAAKRDSVLAQYDWQLPEWQA